MTLLEAIRDLDTFGDHDGIYAAEPWTRDSECVVVPIGGDHGAAVAQGFCSFPPVHLLREFVDGWQANVDHALTAEEKCERLIHYGMFDA